MDAANDRLGDTGESTVLQERTQVAHGELGLIEPEGGDDGGLNGTGAPIRGNTLRPTAPRSPTMRNEPSMHTCPLAGGVEHGVLRAGAQVPTRLVGGRACDALRRRCVEPRRINARRWRRAERDRGSHAVFTKGDRDGADAGACGVELHESMIVTSGRGSSVA